MWEAMEATFAGAATIRNTTAPDDANEDNDLNAIAVDAAAEWTVQAEIVTSARLIWLEKNIVAWLTRCLAWLTGVEVAQVNQQPAVGVN